MQRNKIKLVVLYQVIMHYRVPLYKRIAYDDRYDFTLLYGKGRQGTKLVNVDNLDPQINAKRLKTIRIPFKIGNRNGTLSFFPFLFFYLIFLSPKVILSEGSSSLLNASFAFIYCKLFRKKFIWWSLGTLKGREYKGVRKWINKWEYVIEKHSDAIFTYSTQGKKYFLERGISEEKVFVAINVLDTNKKLLEIERFKETKSNFHYSDFFNIAFIGSITKEKKLELLTDSLVDFNNKNNNLGYLHIIGDGVYIDKVKEYAAQRGLDNYISFYGRINEGASQILQYCDVMVLPGYGGLAICEGMLNSLPVIAGIADGTELDLIDESNGFIITQMNKETLLEKLEILYKEPLLKQKMGYNSYIKITTTYNFDNYYNIFNKCVHSVIK